jgi:methyltransferase (TIGR00027 family)
MDPGKPSQTALATAFLRALHLVVDDPPWVFEDHAAATLLPAYQQRFLKRLAALPQAWTGVYRQRYGAFAGMRSQVIVRARYAEDALAAARQRGCERYVVLAAGLDTFAVRQAQAQSPLPVLEIDHPSTQQWKRELLAGLGLDALPAVTYLPIDFEQRSLEEQLQGACPQQFISWLGTTYYLTRDAIGATLTALAGASAAGSELVLDYWREPPLLDASTPLLWGTRVATAFQREPMRSFFEPADIEALAQQAGWSIREHCAPTIQNQRYLRGRGDRLAVPSFAYLLHLTL